VAIIGHPIMRITLIFVASLSLAANAADDSTTDGSQDAQAPTDVIVTATRAARAALDTPASVSRMDAAELADISAKNQADSMNRNAGVYVQRGSGSETLMGIRSPVFTGPGGCGAFLVTEDSLPIRPIGFCNQNEIFELNYEQAGALEILRGPGSAIFGASAVHGVVNLLTPAVTDLPSWGLGFETGSDSFKRLRLSGSHDFGDSRPLELGAYGVATRAPGWRDDSGVDEAKLNLLADTTFANGGSLRVRAAGSVLNQETAGFIQGFDSYKNEDIAKSNPNPEAFRDASSARVAVRYQQPGVLSADDNVELAVLYRRSRMDFIQHFLIGKPFEHNAQTSYLLSASDDLPFGRFRFRAVVDAESADTELTEYQPNPSTDGSPAQNVIRPAGYHYDYTVEAWTLGGTLSLEYHPVDALTATAALRANWTNYNYDNRMIDGNTRDDGTRCPGAGCLYSRPADRTDQFDNLSPSLTLAWRVTPGQLVYLNGSSGFRPPEMTEMYRLQRQQSVADLGSEELRSVEFGWKYARANTRLSAALFDMKKEHVILREANGFNVSDGSTSHRGFEYEARQQFATVPLTLSLAGTVARHLYDFSRSVDGGETIVKGNDVDTAPRNIHTAALDWVIDGLAHGASQLELHLDGTWLGPYYLDAANTATYPGHKVANFRTTWQPGGASGALRVDLRIDNLFDIAYADRADFAFGNYRYFPARGRAFFVSFDYTGG